MKKEKLKNLRSMLWLKDTKCFVCRDKILHYQECTIEHILPLSKGGKNHKWNIGISHWSCNNFRGSMICRLEWENKKVYVKKIKKETTHDMIKLWLQKYGLIEEDLILQTY